MTIFETIDLTLPDERLAEAIVYGLPDGPGQRIVTVNRLTRELLHDTDICVDMATAFDAHAGWIQSLKPEKEPSGKKRKAKITGARLF